MKGTECSLLGRNLSLALHFQVKGINHVGEPALEITEVLGRHPDAFTEDIDSCTGPFIHLDLEDGAMVKFCEARSVPLVLQGRMEDKLDRL